jgi:hypothetical protein
VAPVQSFLTGAQPVKVIVEGLEVPDVAYWSLGGQVCHLTALGPLPSYIYSLDPSIAP